MKKSSQFRAKPNNKSSALVSKGQGSQSRLPMSKRPTLLGHDLVSEAAYGFTKKQRENHTHVIGSTGTGKSKVLELMIRQDIQNRNCGMCLLDPHGKLYEDVLAYVATEKSTLADRIVTFNPFNDLENIVGFNPIPSNQGRFDYIEENFISSCLKAWGQDDIHETPRITRWLQNIVHTLLMNDMTLLESAALVSSERDNVMRQQMIANLVDERVRVEWQQFIESNLRDRNNLIEGAGNRLSSFLNNEIIRLIIGQRENVLDLAKIMKEGKILLINLHDESGRVPHPSAKLLGTMIISELYRLIQLRDWKDPKLKHFYVYIDEFAQYVTRDIGRTLEEVRKFKASFVLAHQHLTQLKREDEYLYASVMTNCKNKVVFGGLSEEDSDLMTKEIQTGFIDLKTIKHEQMRIRERHIESKRLIRQEQYSKTEGSSHQENRSETSSTTDTVSKGVSETNSQSETKSKQRSSNQSLTLTETTGRSESHATIEGRANSVGNSENQSSSLSHSDGKSEGLSFNRSRSEGGSQAYSKGISDGESHSRALGISKNQSSSSSNANNWNDGRSSGSTDGYSDSQMSSRNSGSASGQSYQGHEISPHSNSRSSSDGNSSGQNQTSSRSSTSSNTSSQGGSSSLSQTHGKGESQTDTHGKSKTHNRSETNTNNYSDMSGSGENWGNNSSDTRSEMKGRGQNSSSTKSSQNSHSQGSSQSNSRGVTEGTSEGEGYSQGITKGSSSQQGEAHSDGEARSFGSADGTSQSVSKGYSEGYTPFLEPHEVEELSSVQFWSRDDLMYMKKAQMKNLPVAQAFVKIESNPPVHCQVANMPEIRCSQRLLSRFTEQLQKKIVAKNSELYVPLKRAQDNIAKRQDERFGDVIRFYDALRSEHDDYEEPEDESVIDPAHVNPSKDYFGD